MAQLVYNEIKKILKQERLFLVVIALLFTNHLYNKQLLFMRTGYQDYVHYLDGMKLEEVPSILRSIDVGDMLADYFNQEVMKQFDYSNNYSQLVEEMVGISKHVLNNTLIGSEGVAVSKFIIDTYQYRDIDSFIFPEATTRYLNNNFSTLLLLVLFAFIGSSIYSKEKESGVLNMQIPTRHNRRLVHSKSLALLVVIIGFSSIFYFQDWLMFNRTLVLGNANIALFALPTYASTPLNLTILGFMILRVGFNIIGIWLFSLFFALVSLVSKKTLVSLVINMIVLIGVNALPNLSISYLNPYSIFSINTTFTDLNFEIVLGRVVLTPYITLGISIILILFIGFFSQKLYMGKRY